MTTLSSDPTDPRRPVKLLGQLLLLSAVEAMAGLAAAMMHSSEPGSRILGPYSGVRLALIGLLAALMLLCIVAGVASFRRSPLLSRLAVFLLGQPQTLPRLSALLLTSAFAFVAVLVVVFPDATRQVNAALLGLFVAVLVWMLAAWAQLLTAWVWLFHRDRFPPAGAAVDPVAAALLAAVAFAVRAPMVTYGLPYVAAWDEVVTFPQALRAIAPTLVEYPDPIPGYGPDAGYGEILVTLTKGASVIGLFDSLRSQTVSSLAEYVSPPAGVNSILQAVHPSGNPLVYPRLLFALINSLAPAAIYLILRLHLRVPRLAALGGALAYAVFSFQVAYNSSFILPDGLGSTLILFSLLLAFMGMESADPRRVLWLASGLLAGAAASTTLRSVHLPLLPLMALLLSVNRKALPTRGLVFLGGVAAGYLISAPSVAFDLPQFIARESGNLWHLDASLEHRAESLAFYIRSVLSPGTTGLGLGVLAFCGPGLYQAFTRRPRTAIAIALFSAIHLYLITPIVQRYTRHALVLLPLLCVLAGYGLLATAEWLERALDSKRPRFRLPLAQIGLATALGVFVLLSAGQIQATLLEVMDLRQFKPSQVQVAEYLALVMTDQDVAGLQEELPFIEQDLQDRGLSFKRVGSDQTVATLRASGVTYVVGTSRLYDNYRLPPSGLWHAAFEGPSTRLAEFGSDDLRFEGWPTANLFMFVARVPSTSPQ